MRQQTLAWLAVLGLGLGHARSSAAAGAPPEPEHSSADKEHAQQLLREGADAYARGDPGAALIAFQQAYAAYPSPKLLFNIGQAELALGHAADAADSFSAFLEDDARDVNLDDAKFAFARETIRDLLAKQRVVRLKLAVEPAGATVRLDHARAVRSEFYLDATALDAPHLLEAQAPGHADGQLAFTLRSAQASGPPLHLALAEIPAAPPPLATSAAPAPAGATADPAPLQAERTLSRRQPVAYALWAAGGALALGGLGTGLWVVSQAASVHGCGGASLNACASRGNTRAASVQTAARVADGLWVGAALAAAAGGVVFFVAPEPGGGAGVGAQGHF